MRAVPKRKKPPPAEARGGAERPTIRSSRLRAKDGALARKGTSPRRPSLASSKRRHHLDRLARPASLLMTKLSTTYASPRRTGSEWQSRIFRGEGGSMSTEVSEAIIEALQSITSTHLRQTRGLIYPWLDAAHDLVKNISHIQAVFDLLSDNKSRLTYLWFLKFRLAGYISQSREFAHQAVPQLISEASWSEMLRLSETIPEKELEGHLPVDVIENYILDGYNLTRQRVQVNAPVV